MRVLIGCEYSQVVTNAFRENGHDAYSCDILPTEGNPHWHFQEDIFQLLKRETFDLAIYHPPCTHIAVSGARHFALKRADGRQQFAIDFFMRLAKSNIRHIAIENPVCIMSTVWRKPDQIIQPWQFGHGETKATCLWLKNLPLLLPTDIVGGREARIHNMPPGPNRWRERSRTYTGIAKAMSSQWGIV